MFGSFKRALVPLLGFAAVVCLPVSAGAIQQPGHLRGHAELELANPSAPLRSARVGTWAAPRVGARGRAYARLEAELGPGFATRFDVDTGVLDTLIPAGLEVADASRSPAAAERFAHDFLVRHIDLLAPGSSPADFQLVSDVDDGGVRSVGLVQTHAGLEVVGGQLSFRFKNDRLIAVRSQALPDVSLIGGPSTSATRADAGTIEAAAVAWIADDFAGGRRDRVGPSSATIEGPMILPLVRAGAGVEYREVVSVEVELAHPHNGWAIGRWLVYLDARTGAPVARRSLLRWAELEFAAWQRSPLGPRQNFPARFVEATVNGQPVISDQDGALAVPGVNTPANFGTDGVYLQVFNDNGPVSSIATQLDPGEIFTWDLGANVEEDAQLNGYVHTQIVKDYVRAIEPNLPGLDLETLVTVNIDDVCNAFADENTINFFLAGEGCQNSALIADVVYHEYGHVAHILGIIEGVGLFDGAHSEGASDYLSATIVEDPDVGRGFFLDTDAPIRELDPDGFEWHWPEDTGEVHDEGRIIGGTLWDLRVALSAKYGPAVGVAKTDRIWLDGIRRAVDIPSTYLEALITNDDDGNLQNGTPDICEINEVFAAHGLFEPPGAATAVETVELDDGSLEITMSFGEPFAGCPGTFDPSGVVRYRRRGELGDPPGEATELMMTEVGTGVLRAVIPPQPDLSVTQFQVELDWGNGTSAERPDNFGDPWYEHFNGEATEIWCSDFETPADIVDWQLDGEWSWGPPNGSGGDPDAAYQGTGVLGVTLGWTGLYSPWSSSFATSPSIDVSGFEVVRLQYRRWLNVEDGFWDQAILTANGEVAWENLATDEEFFADVHHRDREWRFHDVVLTPYVGASGQVALGFEQHSDGGLEFGGWTIDSMCLVGHGAVPEDPGTGKTVCGDGILQQYEQCDDGNLKNGDGCSSGCLVEDDDPVEPEQPLDDDWDPTGRGCGCSTDEGGPRGWSALALLGVLGLGLRRRPGRRRR